MRDFFKYVFASMVGLILFTTLGVGALISLIVSIAITSGEPEPRVKKDSVLVFDLAVEITDSQPTSTAGEVIGEALAGTPSFEAIALRDALSAIREAANDDRIVALYLKGNINPTGLGSGFAVLREVRQALEDFQASGKPILAYEMSWNERDYYLTSAADTVVLNPNGLLEINGFKSEALFFAEALDRLGIGISAIRAGQYKSAVEPFLRNNRSPQEQEQAVELLTDLWGEFLEAAATDRDVTTATLQTIADTTGLMLPSEALDAKLVDQVAYFDQVLAELRSLTNETEEDELQGSFRQVSLIDYADTVVEDDFDGFDRDNQIAIVYAEGNIVDGEGGFGQIGGDRFARVIRSLRNDEDVAAVVLRINSPGGSAAASDVIAHEVKLTREEKPVVVSMGSLAASGGYLIATFGDEIFASPNTITGSIGVFGLFPNIQELANENGITWDVVKTGRYADIGTISRPPTEAEVAIAQRFVDKVYDDFLTSVATSRSLPRDQVEDIAQGRVWSGLQAEQLGLVDTMGGLEAAIGAAAERAELEDWTVVEYPRTQSFEEQLLEQLLSEYRSERTMAEANNPLIDYLYRLRFEFETLRSLNDPRGVYIRLPLNYWIH